MATDSILRFNTISEYNAFNKHQTLHPLVSVIDLSKADPRPARRMSYGFYTVFLKQLKCGDLRYGLKHYDYQEGTLIFLGPGQVIGENVPEYTYQPQGWALVFHPDLIHGTSLGRNISNFTFFSYDVHEALHISEQERQMVLDYCVRFYDRQFYTRDNVHKGIIEKLDHLLNDYFRSDNPQTLGLPNVAFCAEQLHLSPNYFGDLIRKETGKSALEYIQGKIMNLAKEKMFDTDKTVSEIAYELGFKYPQHFSRLFKQRLGHTPNEYRAVFFPQHSNKQGL